MIACLFISEKIKEKSDSILLIPAANLDGGFGDDLMVVSFIDNFSQNRPVTLYTSDVNRRPDYLSGYKNIKFVGGLNDKLSYLNALKLLKQHSLVYLLGADNMDGSYGIQPIMQRFRLLKMASQLKIETQISGLSVSNTIPDVLKGKFIQASEYMLIKARDIESYKRLVSFLPPGKMVLTSDIAFICPLIKQPYQNTYFRLYQDWIKSVRQNGRKVIAICPNSMHAQKLGSDIYLNAFKTMIDEFISESHFAIAFLYHDLRKPDQSDNDRSISEKLYAYYKAQNVDCYFNDNIKNGLEIKRYLELIDFTITGRMHFGISGLICNKPMFGITYADKFEGMIQLFGIDPYCCLIDYHNIADSKAQVSCFKQKIKEVNNKVSDALPSVLEICKTNYKSLLPP